VGGLRFVDLSTNYFRIFEPAGNIAIYLGNAGDPSNYFDNTNHVFRNRGGSSVYALINSNGNLGIGTTSPAYKLEVAGAIRSSFAHYNTSTDLNSLRGHLTTMGYSLTNTPSGAGWITVYTSQNNGGDIISQIAYDNYNQQKLFTRYSADFGATWSAWKTIINSDALSGTTNYVPKFTGTNSIGNSLIYDNGTNVGIGTTSPSTPLHVFNTAATLATFTRDLATDVGFSIGADSNGTIFSTAGAHAYLFYTNGTEKIRITSDGNLGIGTTSPTNKLEIITATNDTSGVRVRDSANGVWTEIRRRSIECQGGDFWINGQTSGLELRTGNTSRLYINSTGNVGIGVTSPSTKLHVNGGNVYVDTGYNYTAAASSGYWASGLVSPYQVGWYESSGAMLFRTGGSEKMRIAADGNVGIGTTSPSSKLHIDDINAPWITISRSGTPTWQLRNNYPNNQYGFSFNNTTAGTVPLFIGAGGSIGIGLDNPAYKLEISAGTSNAVVAKLTQGYERVRYYGFDLLGYNDGNLWMIGNNATNGLILGSNWDWDAQAGIYYTPGTYGAAGGSLEIGQLTKNNANFTHGNTRFYTNGIERMRITSGGNVGIGTTSPVSKLHIVNSGNYQVATIQGDSNYTGVGGGQLRIRGNTNVNKTIEVGYNTSTDVGFIQAYVNTGSAQTICLNPDGGNVGIGTVSTSYKLDVNGAAHATSFPTSSDVRFKKNITPLQNSLEKIKKLQGVKYEWNEFINSRRDGYKLNIPIIGLIAQDVEQVVPEIVDHWKLSEDCQDARSIDYPRLIPLLIEAMKEQQNQIEELRNEIKSLKSN
jgi:hypothetical protein